MSKITGKVVGIWSDSQTVSMNIGKKKLLSVGFQHFKCLPETGDMVDFSHEGNFKLGSHRSIVDTDEQGADVWGKVKNSTISAVAFKVLAVSSPAMEDYVEDDQQAEAGIPEEEVPFDS